MAKSSIKRKQSSQKAPTSKKGSKKKILLPFSWSKIKLDEFSEFSLDFSDKEYARSVRKPKPFRSLEATGNNYRGSTVPKPEPLKDDEWPICDCKPGSGCGDDCMNRQLFIECHHSNCQGGYGRKEGCGNSACQKRDFPETEVYLTPGCGWGLRLTESITRGRPIIEYCGEVISSDTCKERLKELKRGDDFYFASLTSSAVLDAAAQGSNARFANHSCNPNCVLEKWLVGGIPKVVLSARVDLQPGAHCVYNYMADTMNGLVRRQECQCGSSNCCGLIGGRVAVAAETGVVAQAEKLLNQAKPRLEKLKEVADKSKELKLGYHPCLDQVDKLIEEADGWIKLYHQALSPPPPPSVTLPLNAVNPLQPCVYLPNTFLLPTPSSLTTRSLSAPTQSHIVSIASSQPVASSSTSTSNLSISQFDDTTLKRLLVAMPTRVSVPEASLLKDKVNKIELLKKSAERFLNPPMNPTTLKRKADEEQTQSDVAYDVVSNTSLSSSSSSSSSTVLASLTSSPLESRPNMSQLLKALEIVEYCKPVSAGALGGRLQHLVGRVESWALKACRDLKLKSPSNKVKTDSSSNRSLEFLTSQLEEIVELGFQFSENKLKEVDRSHVAEEEMKVGKKKLNSHTHNKKTEINQPVDEHEDKDKLHCFCRLRETSTEATMVKCEGADCGEWYHISCVHETSTRLRSKGKFTPFICPVCLYKKGCPSLLACPPTKRARKVLQAPLPVIQKVLTDAQLTLPIQGLHAVSFLACIVDNANDFITKSKEALDSLDNVRDIQQQGVVTMNRFCNLISEGLALQVDNEAIIVELRKVVWKVVVSGSFRSIPREQSFDNSRQNIHEELEINPMSKEEYYLRQREMEIVEQLRQVGGSIYRHWHQEVGCFEFGFIQAMLQYGKDLGLCEYADWIKLEDHYKTISSWLTSCLSLPFESEELFQLSLVALPFDKLNLSQEPGFKRLLASLAHRDKASTVSYCFCRLGDHGGKMIGCDTCEQWFHTRCLNARPKNAGPFICEVCLGLQQAQHFRTQPHHISTVGDETNRVLLSGGESLSVNTQPDQELKESSKHITHSIKTTFPVQMKSPP